MFGATRVDQAEQGLSPEQKLANAQTQHTQRVQSNARSIEQAHSIIRDVKNGQRHNQEYQGAKDQLTAGLEQRKDLVLIQAEAQRLAEAGDLRTATALLNGEMSLDQLDQTRLKANNPDVTRITGPSGQELSDQEVVTQERTALQETINQNRIAIAQLTARTQEFDQEIQRREQASLSKKSQIAMEQRTLLAAEQERLERETQRLFQRHDAVTKAINEGDLSRARDILEGRQAVLEPGQKAESKQSGEELASRNFARTQEEEQKYQASQTALQEVQEQEAQHAVLETGVKTNLTETKKDIKKNSGWLASWGGHTDALKQTAAAESARLENFEQQRATIDRAKTQAQTLIAQGKYDEATELLRKTKDLASKDFKESNSGLQESYKAVNEDLAKFDQNLKDSAVEVSKQVAVGVVAASAAAALAPATGGMSLAAFGTMIGGGSLAGFAAGTAIDVVNAGVDMSVFGDDSKTAFGKALSKAGGNAQTALIGALGGAAAGGIMTKLAELGKGATLASLGAATGASAATSTADIFARRVVAEREWKQQGGGTAEEKEAFMKANGVDAASLGKSWLAQTGGGAAGGLLGIRTSAAKEASRSALRESGRELAESTGEALIGLAAAYAEHGELTPDTIAETMMDVAVGNKMSKMTQNHFESRTQRNRSTNPSSTEAPSTTTTDSKTEPHRESTTEADTQQSTRDSTNTTPDRTKELEHIVRFHGVEDIGLERLSPANQEAAAALLNQQKYNPNAAESKEATVARIKQAVELESQGQSTLASQLLKKEIDPVQITPELKAREANFQALRQELNDIKQEVKTQENKLTELLKQPFTPEREHDLRQALQELQESQNKLKEFKTNLSKTLKKDQDHVLSPEDKFGKNLPTTIPKDVRAEQIPALRAQIDTELAETINRTALSFDKQDLKKLTELLDSNDPDKAAKISKFINGRHQDATIKVEAANEATLRTLDSLERYISRGQENEFNQLSDHIAKQQNLNFIERAQLADAIEKLSTSADATEMQQTIPYYKEALELFKKRTTELAPIKGIDQVILEAAAKLGSRNDDGTMSHSVFGFFSELNQAKNLQERGLTLKELGRKVGKDEIDTIAEGTITLEDGTKLTGEFYLEQKRSISTFMDKNFTKAKDGTYKIKQGNQMEKIALLTQKHSLGNGITGAMFDIRHMTPEEQNAVRTLVKDIEQKHPEIKLGKNLIFLNSMGVDISHLFR